MKNEEMRMKKGIGICAIAVMAAVAADAGMIEETLTLTNGWNAVYIESTPENPDAADFFGDMGVTKASCYISSVYSQTAQMASDGSDISQKPVSHFIYDANRPDNSTLKNINGGLVYLIFATNATKKTFFGTPQIPRVSWQVSDSGFATLVPILVPKGEEDVLATEYFDGAPCGAQNAFNAWTIFGRDDKAPTFAPISAIMFTRKPKVKGGGAYALESESAGEWAGVIEVSAGLSDALNFSDGQSSASLIVRNASTKERDVQISLAESALATDVAPTLNLYVPQTVTEASRWEAFSSTNATIAAGESRTFIFQCDKSGLSEGDKRAAVLAVEDLGGTKMRVRLPVTVEADTYPEGEAAYPTGLWIGTAKLLQVAQKDGTLAAAGGTLESLILLHVDSDGAPTLLQRVAVTREEGEDGEPSRIRLYANVTNAPSGSAPRRISSIFLDTANRAVPATANTDGTEAEFGNEMTFRFTVDERSKENPFRHPWHPDHDGLKADYSGDAPSGDSTKNFIGPVKPESFSITNTVTFAWKDDFGTPMYSRTPDETTFGRLDWILTGLRNTPIHIRGIFTLKRVCATAEIKE